MNEVKNFFEVEGFNGSRFNNISACIIWIKKYDQLNINYVYTDIFNGSISTFYFKEIESEPENCYRLFVYHISFLYWHDIV